MKILVDMNLPKEVAKRLNELGFDVIYLSEVLPSNTKDEVIAEWMAAHNALILTRDKRFPTTEEGEKVILARLSERKLSREAVLNLVEMRCFPKGLEDSAELNAFADFLKDSEDPFFNALRLKHKGGKK
jgi:predicted nuclease of predicted toxin-antitoxin system